MGPPSPPALFTVTDGLAYCEVTNGGTCVTDGAGDYGNDELCTVRSQNRQLVSGQQLGSNVQKHMHVRKALREGVQDLEVGEQYLAHCAERLEGPDHMQKPDTSISSSRRDIGHRFEHTT